MKNQIIIQVTLAFMCWLHVISSFAESVEKYQKLKEPKWMHQSMKISMKVFLLCSRFISLSLTSVVFVTLFVRTSCRSNDNFLIRHCCAALSVSFVAEFGVRAHLRLRQPQFFLRFACAIIFPRLCLFIFTQQNKCSFSSRPCRDSPRSRLAIMWKQTSHFHRSKNGKQSEKKMRTNACDTF